MVIYTAVPWLESVPPEQDSHISALTGCPLPVPPLASYKLQLATVREVAEPSGPKLHIQLWPMPNASEKVESLGHSQLYKTGNVGRGVKLHRSPRISMHIGGGDIIFLEPI